jgi:protein TonB
VNVHQPILEMHASEPTGVVADGAGEGTPAPASPVLAIPAPLQVPRRRQLALTAAVCLSVLAHASSLLAFLHWGPDVELGAVATQSEAISVEIVESRVLEEMQRKESSEPAPSVEAAAPQEGSVDAAAMAAEKPPEVPKKAEAAVPPPPVPEAVDDKSRMIQEQPPKTAEAIPVPAAGPGEKTEQEQSDQQTVAKPKEPPEEEAERKAQAEKTKREEEEAKRQQEIKEAQRKEREQEYKAKFDAHAGGATSRASVGQGKGGERASASNGALLQYAAHVRSRVASRKPPGRGMRGTSVVSFGLTETGLLAYANIAKSSGAPSLDEAALSAIRNAAPFPMPPTGASPVQLQYTIPFRFR